MILLADIGNTRIKWGRLDKGRLTPGSAAVWHGGDPKSVFDALWAAEPAPVRVLVSTVVHRDVVASLLEWVDRRWSIKPEFASVSRAAHGVTNGYKVPERLGVDRWLALIAVRRHYPGAACVIDCGTATTLDVLSDSGQHLGGLIVPGLELMRRSLASGTEALREQATSHLELLACDTQDAITAGTFQALAGFIERMAGELPGLVQGPCRNIVTGGDGERMASALRIPFDLDPHLVLRGLAVVAEAAQ